MNKIEIIILDRPECECNLCGKIHLMDKFLPMYENKVVSVDHNDDWAGCPVCNKCYDNSMEKKR